MADPEFTVDVQGHLVTNGVWRIDAKLRFRDGLDPQVGDELLGRGRLALLEGITREGARGRALGATSCRVFLDVAGRVSELALGDLIGPEPTH